MRLKRPVFEPGASIDWGSGPERIPDAEREVAAVVRRDLERQESWLRLVAKE